MNNIKVIESPVSFKPAKITFSGYEECKKQAMEIASYIDSVELTEENVKEVKEDLADARKVVTLLGTSRKSIKKAILSEFNDFESQIKEISKIIDEADSRLRMQLRVLEEKARDDKKEEIRSIWAKRMEQYRICSICPNAFDRWLKPNHLNKTTKMNVIEKDMTEWLETREKELEFIDECNDRDEVLAEYLDCLDPLTAMSIVQRRREVLEKVKVEEPVEQEVVEVGIFVIKGKSNIKLVELLLKENEISYEKK